MKSLRWTIRGGLMALVAILSLINWGLATRNEATLDFSTATVIFLMIVFGIVQMLYAYVVKD